MDEQIFEQLDRLEHDAVLGTRSTAASGDYAASRPFGDGYGQHAPGSYAFGLRRERFDAENDMSESPVVLDSFDKQLLRGSEPKSRQPQAARGHARLSLPWNYSVQNQIAQASGPHMQPILSQRHDLPRFAHDAGCHVPSSPPSHGFILPSSPAFRASQRRQLPSRDLGLPRPPRELEMSGAIGHEWIEDAPHSHGPEAMSLATLPRETTGVQFGTGQVLGARDQPSSRLPIVQGIQLVSTRDLPDRFRAIFPYPMFNAIQSKCFKAVYKSDDNLVLSSPTGSGKTVILELAICRLMNRHSNGAFKIVYQAPTKALCAERHRDWQSKFGPLDLACAELTGDSDHAQLRHVQQASIIITTPEKWDSMTRKWKDHRKLMQMVKLFLIDEVHIVKEDRGATLEAVVSRMKSVGSEVRFIALSATVPNFEDIATWLGKDSANPHVPAVRERFGEEFRPVRLVRHVVGYSANNLNDFAFEKVLNGRLTDVIAKWSRRKPIMVFCFTRASCAETAKLLAKWWQAEPPTSRHWNAPHNPVAVTDGELGATVVTGVAFHHAGVPYPDRLKIEQAYLQGDISVICCTSTLAVGVNLPCHMVIIKNTVAYQSNAAGCKEYSDLEIMQMLGRAGRPQFDDSGIAVIMTRQHRGERYEKMITGEEILESCLHRNLIDHLNAEIGLGTVTNVESAKKWLSGTFLYVRLKENPEHYKIEDDAPGRNLDERLENICARAIAQLQETRLISAMGDLHCTEFGDAMARYYVQFQTMKIFLSLPAKTKVSEILAGIAQAAEFRDLRFRAGEKPGYKTLNQDGGIKFPIPVNLDLPAHKVSLVIQATLGCVELNMDHKQNAEFNTARALIFQHVPRLIRCIVDCQLHLEDGVGARNALMLARSFSAQVWDNSPLHMKQLESVGIHTIRKFVAAGIMSIDDLESVEPLRIETAASRNPPFGHTIQEKAREFPKLRVSIKMVGEAVVRKNQPVTIKVKAEVGFLNEKIQEYFRRVPIFVCLLIERSDGRKVHFVRITAKKVQHSHDVLCSTTLTAPNQTIRASVMCDQIAGTMRQALITPDVPATAFPAQPTTTVEPTKTNRRQVPHAANTSKRRSSSDREAQGRVSDGGDEFGDVELDDADLVAAEGAGFIDIDDFDVEPIDDDFDEPPRKKIKTTFAPKTPATSTVPSKAWSPSRLANGKWACNHMCKDKSNCKHLCCHEGLDHKPRRPPKVKESSRPTEPRSDPRQTQLKIPIAKRQQKRQTGLSNLSSDATSAKKKTAATHSDEKFNYDTDQAQDLQRLHDRTTPAMSHVPRLIQPSRTLQLPQRSNKTASQPRSTISLAKTKLAPAGEDEDPFGLVDSDTLPEMDEFFDAPVPIPEDIETLDLASDFALPSHQGVSQPAASGSESLPTEFVDKGHTGSSSHRISMSDTPTDRPGICTTEGHRGVHTGEDRDEENVSSQFFQPAPSIEPRRNDSTTEQTAFNLDPSSHGICENEVLSYEAPVNDAMKVNELCENEANDRGEEDVGKWFERHFGTELFNLVE